LVLASSDMNHYESDQVTRVKDHKAIEQILALNPRGLYDVVMNEDISMCGYGPTIAMLTAAQRLGHDAELIKARTFWDCPSWRTAKCRRYAGIESLVS